MGKITPGFKTILVIITFFSFTNFILSETKLDFSDLFRIKSAPAMHTGEISVEIDDTNAELTFQAAFENTVYESKASTNDETPEITLENNQLEVCAGAAQATLSFSTTNNPTHYSIAFDEAAFNNINNQSLNSSPITLPIPAQLAAGTYNAQISVSNENETGTPVNFTIEIKENPTVHTIEDMVVCSGDTVITVDFSGNNSETTYSWSNNTPAIGLGASGNGNIYTFNALNIGDSPVTATITVIPEVNGCTGETQTFNITVNPTPAVNPIEDIIVCNGASVSAINFSGNLSSATYSWTNDASSIGIASSGTGNIPAFTAVNNGNNPVTSIITVIPEENGCTGEPQTFNITVNPTPLVNPIEDIAVCNGASVSAINFSGNVEGATYSWANNTPTIGLSNSGNGNISAFTAVNNGNSPITATIAVTPEANDCTGETQTFTITVNPTPAANPIEDIVVCNGGSVDAINFSGNVEGATYSWVNNIPTIGLTNTGNGNISAFTAVNNGDSPITATIAVTPEANACMGEAQTFTITVNPTPAVNSIEDIIVCNGGSVSAINFSGNVDGVTYSWTNNTPSIGLSNSGNGNISAFTPVNNGNSPITATITVTPNANNCTGDAQTFTITVNPTPTVNTIENIVVCNGGSVSAINFTGNITGATYSWENNTPSIGLSNSGNGNISAFTPVNNGNSPITATITVTPNANDCTGMARTFTITVNPTPTVNTIENIVVCNGGSVSAINFTGNITGATYSWTNNTPSIGLASNGNGNIPTFNAVNTSNNVLTSIITVIPRANNCDGEPIVFTITINPTPAVNKPMDIIACNDGTVQSINFSGSGVAGTTYRWENNNPGIGLAASGTGNISSFTATNTLSTPQTATVTVYPVANECEGSPQTFTIVINPTITMQAPNIIQPACFGESNGSIEITEVTGGNGDYRYSLDNSNFGSSKIFTGLSAGNYTIYIRDTQSCTFQQEVVVEEPNELSMVDPTSNPTSCFGASDGTVTAGTVTGGNGGYQFSVDNTNFTTNTTFTGLPAGTHTIFVRDSKGCSLQKTVTVMDPVRLTGTVTRTSVSCRGGSDGRITITNPAGGSGNFEYSINGTAWQTSATFSNLSSTTYKIHIRDRNAPSCVVILQENYLLPQPAAPVTIEVNTTRTLAFGTATGTAVANPAGGTPGYTYEWRRQGQNQILQTTKTANNLAAGTYVVTVKDSKGCTATRVVTIIDDLSANIIPTSICENTDALIRTSFFEVEDRTAKGGVAPYTYLWSFGAGASMASATTPGPHRVTYSETGDKTISVKVTDATGASKTFSYVQYVGECYRDNCGSNDIAASAYYVGDANGNKLTPVTCALPGERFIYIDIPTGPERFSLYIEINYAVTNILTGDVTRDQVGGCFYPNQLIPAIAKTFAVDWNCGDRITVENIYYTFSNNSKWACGQGPNPKCFSTNKEEPVSTPLYAIATPNELLCHGDKTGNITVTATGGRSPYQYSLTGANNSYKNDATFGSLAAGTYKVYVKDSNNEIFIIENINITQPDSPLGLSIATQEIQCYGGLVDLTATATGGTPPYTYLWNDPSEQTTATATAIGAGTYTVTVMDSNGCQIIDNTTLTQPEQLSVANAGEDQQFKCGTNSTFLSANIPQTGVGKWELISGTGGVIEDSSNPLSAFSGIPGTYILRWSIAHADGTCGTTDEVNITFVEDCSTLDFDGIDDYVNFGDSYPLNSGTFTLEAWVKPEAVNGVRTIISKRNSRNLGAGGYDLIINNGAPTFRWGNSAVSTSSKVNNNRWYHIAVIFTDSRANLYVDGIRVGNSTAVNPVTTTTPFLIGAMYDANNPEIPQNYFKGWIEEVRVWKTALTEEQLRFMMNQRIQPQGTAVRGSALPLDVPGGLTWDNLNGYYQLIANEIENGLTLDRATAKVDGELKNITTLQENTAPLPYISAGDGTWRDRQKWLRPNVWEYPNATGINGESINWNIAQVHHNFTSGGKDLSLLGLLSESGTITMANPNQEANWQNSGQGLFVTHYLKLNGNIDLVGESQLIQTDISATQSITSVLEESSSGFITRAQQGTANSFNYNYWTSPVSFQGAANNSTYTIGGIMMDGSSTANYGKPLQFHPWHEFADGDYATPRKISNYWLYKFRGTVNVYSEWEHIGSTGTLNAGEGYTMKGTSGNAAIADRQNYVFKGKPNNGTITLNIGTDQNYLLGNPYPSALDVNEFILDNLKDVAGGRNSGNIFNGAVYFWDHFAGKSHILLEYIGGYATRNLLDAVPAVSNDERIHANDAESNKIPGRFIPVAQGFFINTTLDPETANGISVNGGDVLFRNYQRAFVKETNAQNSLFLMPENTANEDEKKDTRKKIRIDFRSPMGYNRQILAGADPNTTNGFDLGYDAPLNDNNSEDMYWIIDGYKYVIQGVPNFDPDQILKLGVKIKNTGKITIKINDLENIDGKMDIYLKDNEAEIFHDLLKSDFTVMMEPGTFHSRFEIVFQNTDTWDIPEDDEEEENENEEHTGDEDNEEGQEENTEDEDDQEQAQKPMPGENLEKDPEVGQPRVSYIEDERVLFVRNPELQEIRRIELYSLSGQIVEQYENINVQKEVRLPVRSYSSSVYAIKMYTAKGVIYKKLIINN